MTLRIKETGATVELRLMDRNGCDFAADYLRVKDGSVVTLADYEYMADLVRAEQLITAATDDQDQYISIGCGAWLATAEGLARDQGTWSEFDGCKDTDLIDYPYWLTTSDGRLIGINDADHLVSYL